MNLFDVYPVNDVVIEKAAGSHVWDNKGGRYLDMYGGHAVISIGHGHPHWKDRIKDQLDKIAFYSNSVKIPIQKQLAEKLGKISGKEDYHLFLVNSGAEANENALKLASFHTGRKKIISFTGAFHGRTSLAVAVTDNPAIKAPVNDVSNVIILPFNDEKALEETMQKFGGEIAAVIIEAIQGVGGIRVATNSFLKRIRTLCDKYGSVFIADEVQCGYGRTGTFYAVDHAGIQADIYTMAKGMGNGFPVAGISIHPKFEAKHSMLGTTFGGNQLACAAALGVLEVIEKEHLLKNAKNVGNYLLNDLKSVSEIQNVRGRGLMIGFDVPEELHSLRQNLLLEQHVFTGVAKPNVIRLLPSLALAESEAVVFIRSLRKEISTIKSSCIETVSVGK